MGERLNFDCTRRRSGASVVGRAKFGGTEGQVLRAVGGGDYSMSRACVKRWLGAELNDLFLDGAHGSMVSRALGCFFFGDEDEEVARKGLRLLGRGVCNSKKRRVLTSTYVGLRKSKIG